MYLRREKLPDGKIYSRLQAPGAGILEVGRPDLPVFGRLLIIPNGTTPRLEIHPGSARIFKEISLAPLLPPPRDGEGNNPPFIKDPAVYSRNAAFPGALARLEKSKIIRGQEATIVWLYPYQYNPVRRVMEVYPDLTVTVRFSGRPRPRPARLRLNPFSRLLRRQAANADLVLAAEGETTSTFSRQGDGSRGACDYLIITAPDFEEAADTLAAWERKSGFKTYVATTVETGSTAAQIISYLQNAYDTWDPAPAYLLLLGDAEFVPTNYRTTHPYSGDLIGTDLYYTTLDGSDYFPDLSAGRISVDNPSEALHRVNAVIGYEEDPIQDTSFYSRAAICAYFQEDADYHDYGIYGVAERRFAQTSEDLAIYLSDPAYMGDYSVDRIYYTQNTVDPHYWSASYFGGGPAGDGFPNPFPSYLLKPDFPWNGGPSQITSAVNEGRFLITHRDHGSAQTWGEPYYSVSYVRSLTNGDKLPVVWSVNCQTGWFDKETCGTPSDTISFSEAWERDTDGGAAGVIAATRVSYSGHNDRLFWGWIDAIWPDFIGDYAGGAPFDQPDYRMGDVLNYGKLYYATKYSDSIYRKTGFEIFHWFGDPAMRFRTVTPLSLSASHPPAVSLNQAVEITVTATQAGVPLAGARATITRADAPDDYRTALSDESGSAVFPDFIATLSGDYAVVVTAPNSLPYQGVITAQDASTPIPAATPSPPPTLSPSPSASPSPSPLPDWVKVIVCLGDSVTHGYPYADNGNPSATYPARLSSLLEGAYGAGKFVVYNRGVNGYKAEDVKTDLLQPDSLSENPDFVLLKIGGNDLTEATPETLLQIIAETTWEVQSCLTLAGSHTNPDGSHPRMIVSAFIPNLLEEGAGTLAIALYNNSLAANLTGQDLWFTGNWDDFFDPATGQARTELMSDLVHPNEAGYQVMGQNWYEALQPFLPPPAGTPAPTATPSPTISTATPSPATTTPSPEPVTHLVVDADDYNGDGSAEPAVFRNTNGAWYVSGTGTFYYGQPGGEDIPIPGDYDGDGTADIAVFRPANGRWWVKEAYPGGGAEMYWGKSGDIPVPADYDGDFYTDTAVWRPSNGVWYLKGQGPKIYFGMAGDIPIPGDYDGDGSAELSVYRPGGVWYIRGRSRIYFGKEGDIPVPGDFNGDGTTDLSVYRPSAGRWYTQGDGYVNFGQSGDIPLALDYNGDGTMERTIFRPSSGSWFIYQKTRFFYGQTGDRPVVGPSY